jgi:hypothetical protein
MSPEVGHSGPYGGHFWPLEGSGVSSPSADQKEPFWAILDPFKAYYPMPSLPRGCGGRGMWYSRRAMRYGFHTSIRTARESQSHASCTLGSRGSRGGEYSFGTSFFRASPPRGLGRHGGRGALGARHTEIHGHTQQETEGAPNVAETSTEVETWHDEKTQGVHGETYRMWPSGEDRAILRISIPSRERIYDPRPGEDIRSPTGRGSTIQRRIDDPEEDR